MKRRVIALRYSLMVALGGLGFALGMWCQQRIFTEPLADSGSASIRSRNATEDDSGLTVHSGSGPGNQQLIPGPDDGPDRQWFPDVLAGGPDRESQTPLPDPQPMTADEREVWDHALNDLPEAQAAEILQLREQLGSVTAAGVNPLNAGIASNAPRLFPVPQDGSLRPVVPADPQSIVLTGGLVPGDEATDRLQTAMTQAWRINVLNVQTPGYKRREIVVLSAGEDEFETSPQRSTGRVNWHARLDLRPGGYRKTGNPLDVAIHGDGFFTIGSESKKQFTRAGLLAIDSDQRVCLRTGQGLLPIFPEITIPDGAERIEVFSGGTIVVVPTDDGGQSDCGKIRLVSFRSPAQLKPVGGSLYEATEESGPAVTLTMDADERWLNTGELEQSNVDAEEELEAVQAIRHLVELLNSEPG